MIFLPVVIMHGLLGDANVMKHLVDWIQTDFPGIHVLNVQVGNGRIDSLLMNIDEQVVRLADAIQADPVIQKYGKFNAICHSQGGLLCRAYLERFNSPQMHNFISWAGPHQGVYGVPYFNEQWLDTLFSHLLEQDAWLSEDVQKHVSFASYWHDPFHQEDFARENIFLADINNARKVKNETYKANVLKLNKMVLIYSTIDEVVVPNVSPIFSYYDYVNASETIVSMKQLPDYQQDWIGLKTLDLSNRLELQGIDCGHRQMPDPVCKKYYQQFTQKWLNVTI